MTSNDELLDEIWSVCISSHPDTNFNCTIKETLLHNFIECTNCNSNNIHNIKENLICYDCGLILQENRLSSHQTYETAQPITYKPKTFSKINRMQEWFMWSNEEKNTYKLKEYVKTICNTLNISEKIISNIIDTVINVMNCIKKNDGTKRARVKDGIIITCIYYVSKNTEIPYSYIDLAKRINLDIKYVTRAERLIIELVNSKKLHLDEISISQLERPYDYVVSTIKKNDLKISNEILTLVQRLINICEDNDILLDHTPLSIGVSCFYYILQLNNINVDLKLFSTLYDISVVTILKTFNKLKAFDKQIEKILYT